MGPAQPADGGYVVSGTWDYCSGIACSKGGHRGRGFASTVEGNALTQDQQRAKLEG